MTSVLLLWWVALAAAAPDDDVRRERLEREQAVAALAAEVASARSAGASRSELARLMAAYRTQAEALAAFETPLLQAALDEQERLRREALRGVRDAVARGAQDEPSRVVLGEWLGDPAARLAVLGSALTDARGAPDPALVEALILDIADQVAAIATCSTYDAQVAEADARRADAQATALRARSGPGSVADIGTVVRAERLAHDAADARQARDASLALVTSANQLGSTATALLGERP